MIKEIEELLENDRYVSFSDLADVFFSLSSILDDCRPKTQAKKQEILIALMFTYNESVKNIYKKLNNESPNHPELLNIANLHRRLAKLDTYKSILESKEEL